MPVDLRGKTVIFVGRLAAMSRRAAARHLAGKGARTGHALTRATDVLVVGHGACALIDDGRLQQWLLRAEHSAIACISENTFLQSLDLLPGCARPEGTLEWDKVAALSGLDASVVRLLGLFDVIDCESGRAGFRDLLAARTVGRLLAEGVPLSIVIESMLRLQPADSVHGGMRALTSAGGAVVVRMDGRIGELDGQLRLPLSDPGNLSAEDLQVRAEQAEDVGDWSRAADLYRRCLALDRSDPTPAFNLANVLCKLNRRSEAKLYLRIAVGLKPAFAEAWYNLAHLLADEGEPAEASAHLRRALDADPDYGDALYNLAQLCLEAGEYAEAARLWERYLRTDSASDWARRARKGLALCRLHLNKGTRSVT